MTRARDRLEYIIAVSTEAKLISTKPAAPCSKPGPYMRMMGRENAATTTAMATAGAVVSTKLMARHFGTLPNSVPSGDWTTWAARYCRSR